MINSIASSLQTFKRLSFKKGLNIILAEKSISATDRQSRNGAGKTSFVNLVHFLCGGNAHPKGIFRSEALRDSTFEMSVQIDNNQFLVSRSGAKASNIIVDGPVENWPILPKSIKNSMSKVISNEEWKQILGHYWFNLPVTLDVDAKYMPSFRSMFGYFVRRQDGGGLLEPSLQNTKQSLWDQQVSLSYLVGLDWRPARDLQLLRIKEKVAKELGRAARSGELGNYMGRAADLRTHGAIAERHADNFRERIAQFHVIPEYRRLEREANDLTMKINQLSEENFIDNALISDLKSSLEDEDAPLPNDMNTSLEDGWHGRLEKLYAEAGIMLPENITRKLIEVKKFNNAIIRNRRTHLKREIEAGELRVKKRENEIQAFDSRRQKIMEILRSGGALEQYSELREELGRVEAKVEAYKQQLEIAEKIESSKSEHDIERARLERALRDDINERYMILEEAIIVFETLSEELYENAGRLTIDPQANGPKFEVKIDSQLSKGITNMQIFCFDIMLMEIGINRGQSPGFLIHDSHIFDGVDERQIAKALQLGARKASELGFQYIITMNSDMIPYSCLDDDFFLKDYILEPMLTDDDQGGLFGMQF